MVAMGIDKEKLMIQLGRLQDHIKELEEVKSQMNGKKQQKDIFISAGERHLQLAIEDCLNIGNHIISAKGFKRADTYKEVFIILKDEKIIPEKLGEAMIRLASFRNRLVHLYWEVTQEEIIEKLSDTDIFRKYAKEILEFVKQK
jgi:uncharacterized protein YutE (UPF0331/DUF86 family)